MVTNLGSSFSIFPFELYVFGWKTILIFLNNKLSELNHKPKKLKRYKLYKMNDQGTTGYKLASTKKVGHLKTIIQETLQTGWPPYKNFLIWGVLPWNDDKTRRLKWKASYYTILDDELFKRGLTTPLLKCLNNQQADYVMTELHEGIYGLHIRGRSLATEVVRASYY